MPVHVCAHFAVVSSAGEYRVFGIEFPYGNVLQGGSDTKADRKPTPFAYHPASLIQIVSSGFSPLNNGTTVC